MPSIVRSLFSFRTILLVLIVAALAGGGAYFYYVQSAGAAGPGFRTEPVVRKNLDATITATGTIEPQDVIDVGAQVQGQILQFGKVKDPNNPSVEYDIDYCTPVTKGTVLAEIDPTIYQARLEQATAAQLAAKKGLASAEFNVAKAEANRDALQDVYQRDKASASAIPVQTIIADEAAYNVAKQDVKAQGASKEQAEFMVQQAEASLKEAQKNVDYCTIKATVDGVIVDRRVNVGQTVVASLSAPSLFLLAKDLMRLEIWVAVNEADIGNVHLGQDVTFTVDARPGKTFHGNVSQIRLNATMTQNVVTYTVVVSTTNKVLDNPTQVNVSTKTGGKSVQTELELLPYLTANLTFHVASRENALLVPNAALRWRPQVAQVAAEFRDEYEQSLHKKGHKAADDATAAAPAPAAPTNAAPANPAPKPDKPPRDPDAAPTSHGTVWVQDGQFVRPVKLTTGLTDGAMTEVVQVKQGETLDEGTMLVTGENQAHGASATTNPFAPPPIFRPQQPKKKDDQ